jgi:hypothetical protein
MKKFPVDVVYTWVDGNDSKWQERKERALEESASCYQTGGISGVGRFRSNDELKYSLRSVARFAPWIRRVFIVTDNQVPDWLDTSNSRVEMVDHRDIFDNKDHLPIFSSRAIELRLHHIKGLSERFLSFNDDFFLGRPTSVGDFFHESGKGKLFTGRKLSRMRPRRLLQESSMVSTSMHHYAVHNARRLVYQRCGRVVDYDMRHGVKVSSRATRHELEREFQQAIQNTLAHRFRDKTDVLVSSLEAYYLIATHRNRPCHMKLLRGDRRLYSLRLFRRKRDFVHISLPRSSMEKTESSLKAIRKYGPLMFCINDGPSVPPEKMGLAVDFLEGYFPGPSEFEV